MAPPRRECSLTEQDAHKAFVELGLVFVFVFVDFSRKMKVKIYMYALFFSLEAFMLEFGILCCILLNCTNACP
jgi:hypothetical protein